MAWEASPLNIPVLNLKAHPKPSHRFGTKRPIVQSRGGKNNLKVEPQLR